MKHFLKFIAVSLCVFGLSGFEAMAKTTVQPKTTTSDKSSPHKTSSKKGTTKTKSKKVATTAITRKATWKAPDIKHIIALPGMGLSPGGIPTKVSFVVNGITKKIIVPQWVADNLTNYSKGVNLSAQGFYYITPNCNGCGFKSEIKKMEKVFVKLQRLGYQDTPITMDY